LKEVGKVTRTATIHTLTTNCTVIVEIVFEKGKSKILDDTKVIEEIKNLLIECINKNHTVEQDIKDRIEVTEVFKYSNIVVRAVVESKSIPPIMVRPIRQFVKQIANDFIVKTPSRFCVRYAGLIA
jgi:hypothetical protein